MDWQVINHSGAQQFYNYDVHILRPQNTESGEPESKKVEEKSQDNNELIFHNSIINAR